jgi:hypothetical protein
MKNLISISLLSLFLFSCIPQVEQAQFQKTTPEVSSTPITESPQVVVDHDNGTGSQQTSSLPVQFIVSESSVEMELSQVKMIPITLRASSFFQSSNVEVNVDYSALLAFEINAGNYITTSLNQSQASMNANGTINLVLTINVNSMAPSFKSVQNGGTGKLILRATAVQDGQEMEQEFQIDLEVKPQLTIGVISDSVPHDYDQANQVYTRAHTEGIQIVFQNKTMNFGANGQGPCIHTTSPLRHCPTTNRMEPGEKYTPDRIIMPDAGYRKAIFYNHFNSSDNIGRYIHFNVIPGDEGA